MIEKEYYRLSELESKFGLDDEDVQYWLERSELSLVFPQPYQKYVFGGWRDSQFIGYGVAEYKGMVSISNYLNKTVFEKGKASAEHCYLVNKAAIEVITYRYEFALPCPNKTIEEWRPRKLEQIDWDRIPAKCYPSVQRHTGKLMGAAFASMLLSIKEVNGSAEEEDKARLAKFQDEIPDVLISPSITLEKKDGCVLRDDLVRLGAIADKKIATPAKTVLLELPRYKNEFHELLAKILESDRSLKTKDIHRILCAEAEREEDSRLYDNKNILLDQVDGAIVWRDIHSKQSEKKCAYSSLGNQLTAVKKAMNQ
jgi:hypothetical protein